MRGQAYELTISLSTGAGDDIPDDRIRPATELLADLEDRFLPEVEREDLTALFEGEGQQEGETIAAWHIRIADLMDCMARRAGISLDEPDEDTLRSKFIEGLRDPFVRRTVARQDPKTWDQCLKTAGRAEYEQADKARYVPIGPERTWRRRLEKLQRIPTCANVPSVAPPGGQANQQD